MAAPDEEIPLHFEYITKKIGPQKTGISCSGTDEQQIMSGKGSI
jgi:hypothetical protein